VRGARAAGLEGTVTYTRLRTDYPRTDPFSGLYLGAFGSVGAQALQLQRFTWEARPALDAQGPLNGSAAVRQNQGLRHRFTRLRGSTV